MQLGNLDIPIGELAPEKVVHLPSRFAVLIILEEAIHVGDGLVETGADPFVGESCPDPLPSLPHR